MIAAQSLFIFDLQWRWNGVFFVFFATLFSYNFQRLTRHKKDLKQCDSERVIWIKQNRKFLLIITLISGITTLSLSVTLSLTEIVFLALPGAISILYSLGNFGLRNLPSLKIILISLVWAASAVFQTIFKSNFEYNLWLMFGVFLYIFSLCIPFDVRDLDVDEANKKTIPQLFGIRKSIFIAVLLFSFSQIIMFWLTGNYWVIISFISGITLLILSLKGRRELFYSGIIDGHIILSSFIIILTCR